MPCLVEGGDDTLLVDGNDHALQGGLSVGVDDGELCAKVAENRPEQSSDICRDEMNAVGVGVVVDGELLSNGGVCDDDDLKACEDVWRELFRVKDVYGDVTVEFADPVEGCLVSGLAEVAVAEEELRAQIGDLDWSRVVESD